jgi:hypothetical protein
LDYALTLSLIEHADMAILHGDAHFFGKPCVSFSPLHSPRHPEWIKRVVRPLFPGAKFFVGQATERNCVRVLVATNVGVARRAVPKGKVL